MNTHLKFFLIFFLIPLCILAQDRIVVKDFMTGETLAGVGVSLKNTDRQVMTDNNGAFSLKRFKNISDKDILLFTIVGYAPLEIAVDQIKKANNEVLLKEKAETLGQVTVTTNAQPDLLALLKFKELSSMPDELSYFGVTLAEGKIYIMGGDQSINARTAESSFLDDNYRGESMKGMVGGDIAIELYRHSDRIYVYDILADSWSLSPHKLSKRAFHNVHYNNGKIYVLGGKQLSKNIKLERLNDKVEVYTIAQDTVLTAEANPHQAVNFASVLVDNNIIVLGGSVKYRELTNQIVKEYTNKVHLLDLSTGLWYEMPDLPKEHGEETKGIIAGNKIYLVGGYRERALSSISTYDITTGQFNVVDKLPYVIERPALAYNGNGTVYIYDSGKLFTYDIHNRELIGYHIDIEVSNAEMLFDNGSLYILGGLKENVPASKMYCINVADMEKTKPHRFD